MLYVDGYESGLRGNLPDDFCWLEGTREMKAMFDLGIASGRRRCT
jgi:hypothetical protein